MGERFTSRSIRCNIWSDWSKPVAVNASLGYNSRSYNCRRDYFAPSGYVGLYVEWRLKPTLTLGFDVDNTQGKMKLKERIAVFKVRYLFLL